MKTRLKELISVIHEKPSAEGRGMHWQMDRLVEESSELIQAVMKVKRYGLEDKSRLSNLYEELSHVHMCLKIVLSFFDKDEFNLELSKKITQMEKTYSKADETA